MRTLAVVVALFLLSSGIAWAQEYPFVHYTTESEINPLPSASVRHLTQDSLGYLWFVVYSSGLVRYDGHTMELFTADDGLPGAGVFDLVEDAKGYLWVSTDTGLAVSDKRISDYEAGERPHFATKVGNIQLETTSIVENVLQRDRDGDIWVGVLNEIIHYSWGQDGVLVQKNIVANHPALAKDAFISTFTVDNAKSIWVGYSDGSIDHVGKDGKSKRFWKFDSDDSPCESIRHLFHLEDGRILAGCRDGSVHIFSEKAESALNHSLVLKPNKGSVLEVSRGSDGAIWVARRQGGALRLELSDEEGDSYLDVVRQFSILNGLPSDWVNSVFEDKEGNFWFAHSAGVSKLRKNYEAFQTWTGTSRAGESPALPSSGVGAITHTYDRNERLTWVGTDAGISVIDSEGGTQWIVRIPGTPVTMIWTLCADSQNRIWYKDESNLGIISPKSGKPPEGFPPYEQFEFKGKTYYSSFIPFVLDRFSDVSSVVKDGKVLETICFSGDNKVSCWVGGIRYDFGSELGIPKSRINIVRLGSKGVLWLGTADKGMFRSTIPFLQLLSAEEGKNYFEVVWNKERGATSNHVQAIQETDDSWWVGTADGISEMKFDHFEVLAHFDERSGLPNKSVTSIAQSNQTKRLWLGTNKGVVEIDIQEKRIIRSLSKRDGLVDNEVWFHQSVSSDDAGSVYFGTPKGLSVYRPHLDRENTTPPRPTFRLSSFEELGDGSNNLALIFSAMSFANEEGVRYKSRVVGYRDRWMPTTSSNSLALMNLPTVLISKTYRVEIMASNGDGYWSVNPLTFSFTVHPPWWASWWFMILFVIALAGGVSWFHRERTRRLEKRAWELRVLADELEKSNRSLDAELRERRRVEGELSTARDKVRTAENELTVARDKREEALADLKQAKGLLIQAEKLSSLGQMVASIAHEIANPVNLMGISNEILDERVDDLESTLEGILDDSPQAAVVRDAFRQKFASIRVPIENSQTAASILRAVTQALTRQARVDTHAYEIEVNEVLEESLLVVGGRLKHFDIEKSLGELPTIAGRRSHIGQVFTNLLANACDAVTEKKDSVNGSGKSFDGKIRVSTHGTSDGSEGVCIIVADSGMGVPENLRQKIFDAFFTTKPLGVGTGLGLSVCAEIIREHDGVMTVSSDEELGGARFEVWLPSERVRS